jgi:hypothetical protein
MVSEPIRPQHEYWCGLWLKEDVTREFFLTGFGRMRNAYKIFVEKPQVKR